MTLPPFNPDLVDVVLGHDTGYPAAEAEKDTPEAIVEAFGETSREFPDALYVPEEEWEERIEENTAKQLWAHNYLDRFTHQGSSHECTCHALRAVCAAARNRQRRISFGDGPQANVRLAVSATSASVWLSPVSVYAEANPGQWGGASCQGVIGIACRRGMLPAIKQPRDWGLKHTMATTCGGHDGTNQVDGSWPSFRSGTFRRIPEHWPDANWTDTAKHFRPLECVNPRSTAQYVSLVLRGYAIGIGRSGHSVPITFLTLDRGRIYYGYADSYNVVRYDSRAYYSSSYSVLSFTTPDDWEKPAG